MIGRMKKHMLIYFALCSALCAAPAQAAGIESSLFSGLPGETAPASSALADILGSSHPVFERMSEAQSESESAAESESESAALIESESESESQAQSESAAAEKAQESEAMQKAFEDNSGEMPFSLTDYRMLRDYPLGTVPKDIHILYRKLKKMTAQYDGEWSVYVQDLRTDQALVVNDKPMKSASVMKLFIMETVYDQIACGSLERTDEIVSLLHDMISNSSNEAANSLLLKLGSGEYAAGISKVNHFIKSSGFTSGTHEYNGFEDSSAVVDESHFNQLTAKDVGLLLSRVYDRGFISRSVCNEIESMMLSQATRYKIPKGIPDGVEVGNKTGEMDTVENDAAVVYGGDTDYILVVLSSDWGSKDGADANIVSLSREVYSFFEEN